MKTEHRIPTTQFGYISLYIEAGEVLDEEMMNTLIADHTRLLRAYNGSEGLPDKEFDLFIDNMLSGSTEHHIETWNKMSHAQQNMAQIIKRSVKRLAYKESKDKEAPAF